MAVTGGGKYPNHGGWLKGRGRGRGISPLIKTHSGYVMWNDWFFAATGGSSVNALALTGALLFTGFAPTVQTPRNITADTGVITYTGFAPLDRKSVV